MSFALRKRVALQSLTFALAIAIIQNVIAEPNWIQVTEKGGANVFYDRTTVKRSNGVVSAQWVSNFVKPQSLRFGTGRISKLSLRYDSRFDCATRAYIVDRSIWFDESYAQGQGHILGASTTPTWRTPDNQHYAGNLNTDVLAVLCK